LNEKIEGGLYMGRKKIVIIGAGPGGLATAMLLSAKGFDVQIFEKQAYIGGRTSSLLLGEYKFDLGPTFLSMPHILEAIFEEVGRDLHSYVDIKELKTMYSLAFDDMTIRATRNREEMVQQIEKYFPGNGKNYERFLKDTREKFEILMPILQNKHDSLMDYISRRSLKAVPSLDLGKSLYDVLSSYFDDERLKISFTFQSKYLGMSPWDCPGAFSILSFIEHEYGIFHPIGGINQLTKAMGKVVEEYGGKIHLGKGVKKLLVEEQRIIGVELENGEQFHADDVIMNADFAHGMSTLIDNVNRKKYRDKSLQKKKYSCSTFMIYAGLKGTVPLDHHTVLFSSDYKKNVDEITKSMTLSTEPSVYVQNASVTDPTLAPEGIYRPDSLSFIFR